MEVKSLPMHKMQIICLQFQRSPCVIGEICGIFRKLSAVLYQDVPGAQLQYDKVSLAFTSLSQSSWYILTRPKATFRPIKTYFASCLLDWRLLVLDGIVPRCGWSALEWKKKQLPFSLRFVARSPRQRLFFSLSSCGIRTAQEELILRDSKTVRTREGRQTERGIEVFQRALRWWDDAPSWTPSGEGCYINHSHFSYMFATWQLP